MAHRNGAKQAHEKRAALAAAEKIEAKKTRARASGGGRPEEEATGAFGSGIQALSEQLASGGRYLADTGLGGLTDDVAQLIRKYPFSAVLLGFGVGCLLARALKARKLLVHP